jgi:hydroxymethylpyrimidine pyrophosphatase-like HAD family hydrolase
MRGNSEPDEDFGIDLKDVIAFGDNYNDIDMLQSVGLGVAVNNARPEVKAAAKEITVDSVKDGVAIVIEKYF